MDGSRREYCTIAGKMREVASRWRQGDRTWIDPTDAKKWGWRVMTRNPGVHVRGAVRHPDHATIKLPFWHRVEMNTETRSRTMANVAFLD